jgi:YggT family protein
MLALVVVAFINIFVPLFSAVLLLRVILSYLMKPGSRLMEALSNLTEPLLSPLRKVFPPAAGVDFAPLVALLLLQGIQTVINSML